MNNYLVSSKTVKPEDYTGINHVSSLKLKKKSPKQILGFELIGQTEAKIKSENHVIEQWYNSDTETDDLGNPLDIRVFETEEGILWIPNVEYEILRKYEGKELTWGYIKEDNDDKESFKYTMFVDFIN